MTTFLFYAADSTGTHSLFDEFHSYEIMFHVSTMLPYTANNKQQVSGMSSTILQFYLHF